MVVCSVEKPCLDASQKNAEEHSAESGPCSGILHLLLCLALEGTQCGLSAPLVVIRAAFHFISALYLRRALNIVLLLTVTALPVPNVPTQLLMS